MTYDPNEPRDKKGEWTTGGEKPFVSLTSHTPESAARAEIISNLAAKSAAALGFKPTAINVTDQEHKFTLNGVERKAAGTADLKTGTINLYTGQIHTNEDVPGLMAHEVMHQKYQTFVNDYQAERAAMEKDPDYRKDSSLVTFDPANPIHAAQKAAGSLVFTNGQFREKGFMRPDGLLNAPYDAKYPTYQAFTNAHMTDSRDFAKTDGVSPYSREWWDAWHGQTASTSQAMHETLAEIARLKFEGNKVQHMVRKPDNLLTLRKTPDPKWTALYRAVEDHWKKRAKK